jgi:hypothetical protein
MEFEYFNDYGLWLFIKYKYAQLQTLLFSHCFISWIK